MVTTLKQALIPIKQVLEAEHIEGNTVEAALRDLLRENKDPRLVPVYMPEIIDGRNEYGPKESSNWEWLTAPSIKATGRTNNGNGAPVVVYAHIPNHFSNPDNIAKAVGQGLIKGAGIMPQYDFQRLVDLAEEQQGKPNQRVFRVDYNALKRADSGLVTVKNALEHPQTIPFLGGQERAEKYLPRHEQFLGKEIGIWHVDDLTEQAPVGRVLHIGSIISSGLNANSNLSKYARFVGVRQGVAAQKLGLEETVNLLGDLVAPAVISQLRERLTQVGYR